MLTLKNISIRRKQVLIIMLTSTVALLLACAAFIAYDTVTFRRELSERVTILADAIGNNCAAAIDFNDSKAAEETLAGLRADGNIVSACVYSRDGRVFAVYQRDAGSSFVPPAVESAHQEFTTDELHLFRDIKQGDVMTGRIFVASDLRNLTSRLLSYMTIVGAVFLTSLLVVLLLSNRLQRLVSDPILHLAQVARAVAQDKNYSLRAKKQSTDEIGQLVDGFNEMLAQIQQRDAALQSARDGLEMRVTERTTELAKTNEALQAENAERKRAEEMLRASQQILEGIINAIPVRVFWKDKNLTYLGCNAVFARDAGFADPKDIIGKDDYQMGWRDQADLYRGDDHQVIESGCPKLFIEEPQTTPDGNTITLLSSKIPLRNSKGEISGILGTYMDITERKRAEEGLRQRVKLQDQLVHTAAAVPGMIYSLRLRPDGSTQMPYASGALSGIFGLQPDDVIEDAAPIFSLIHPDDLGHVQATIAESAHTLNPWRDEFRVRHARLGEIWVEGHSVPQREPDGSILWHGFVQDVTARKRLEARFLQSQKMETVGKLAGGIAHEFNSILTAIIGQSELLLGDLPPGSPLAKNATEISKAAGRAATLTRQLLAYGRKQFLQPEALDLNRVIASMEGMFHHLMGVDVVTQIVPAVGLKAVKADAGQIEQVIMNMAINARDAMPNGGKLTLETANVSFDQEGVGRDAELKPGDYVMLAITDTGAGMSAEVRAHVFEPFFTTKGVGQGTGLGLSTCYGIIKQSGGHISVYSEPARGTTFKIYLPQVEQPTKIPIQSLNSPDLPSGTETILLVEDDPALREMAATLLRRLGYTVLAAADGLEALSLTHQKSTGYIDLLFTDVVMPQMSGKELSDRIHALHPNTKILFTSAYTESAIVHQGALNPGVELLQKPFTPSALARKVREVLDGKNGSGNDSHPLRSEASDTPVCV